MNSTILVNSFDNFYTIILEYLIFYMMLHLGIELRLFFTCYKFRFQIMQTVASVALSLGSKGVCLKYTNQS